MTPNSERDLYRRFGELLAYPTCDLGAAARACATAVAVESPEAARLVDAFAGFVETTAAGRVEEVYSGLFDLDATTPPYVGYHLFGESYKRSAFMLNLAAACRAARIDVGRELPDHLANVLALLAATGDDELRVELVTVALAPALDRMTGLAAAGDVAEAADAPADEPLTGREAYLGVLRALQLLVGPRMVAKGGSR